jgi:hypothetical protein
MALNNSLFEELAKKSILLLSLHGVRNVLEKQLEVKNMLIATDETIKREIDRLAGQQQKPQFPYAYLSMSELIGVKDQNNNRVMQRLGLHAGTDGATKATARKAFMFPVNIGIEFKYIDDKPERAMIMAESLVLLSQIGGLSFEIKLTDKIRFDVRIEVPENTSIPLADTSNTQSPSGVELSAQLIIHTYSGFFRDVAAVNQGNPLLNMEIIMKDDTDIRRG